MEQKISPMPPSNKWTRLRNINRNHFGLFLALTLISSGGCSNQEKAVYVNLDQISIAAATLPGSAGAAKPPVAIGGSPSVKYIIPGASSAAASKSEVEVNTTARVQALIAKSKRQLFESIFARLKNLYQREADALRAKRMEELNPKLAILQQQTLANISDAYQAYATKRGPVLAALAWRVGFPDPDPNSKRQPDPGTFAYWTKKDAPELRRTLQQMDTDFARQRENIFADLAAASADATKKLEQSITQEIGDIEARAFQEASSQALTTTASLKNLLADQPPLALPATPDRSTQIPAQPSSPAPGAINFSQDLPSPQGQRKRLEADLQLWLHLNRYRLESREIAPDFTRSFFQWQTQNDPELSTELSAK